MFTSDINSNRRSALKTALIYLIASIVCAVFGAIYEIFSHGVYSGYMIYAFAFPLLCGTLPFLLLNYCSAPKEESSRNGRMPKENGIRSFLQSRYPGKAARNLYHSAVITFTIGSFMTGILEIYGTTNQLLSIYWFAGAALILAAIIVWLVGLLQRSRRAAVRTEGSFQRKNAEV